MILAFKLSGWKLSLVESEFQQVIKSPPLLRDSFPTKVIDIKFPAVIIPHIAMKSPEDSWLLRNEFLSTMLVQA